ncbi:hypothetical protein OESDEN_24046 [Oesophagostomum dentatum]|uniref:7TM GPCR serpentine receptor class x (Srx) domain-containing protein n=1 Tax=Oesophagostomum dentatum TaxID=61180 RepID=A0A0B1RUG1_OESDE|nr:hypothetical protein OESDEN_24046 [Oesophagostomum dentatum]
MSEKTRRMHSQLLKAITCQACLPLFCLFAVVAYLLGRFKIYHHPIFEYSTCAVIGLVSILSPLISLYFIQPYRIWVESNVLRRKLTTSSTTTIQVSSVSSPYRV